MAALEDRVLTKILLSRTLEKALSRGLTHEHFLNPESRLIYRFLEQHWFNPKTNGELPTIERVQQRWPSFTLTADNIKQEGELSTLIDELKMKSFESDVWSLSNFFKELVDEDPQNAVTVLKKHLIEIEARLNVSSAYQGLGLQDLLTMAEHHYDGAQTGAIYGIPWPWKCLTDDTLGKRGGDFTVFYGRMKSMKTWILLYCAAVDFLNHNKRVLVWSKEMSREKLGLRMAALLSGVDYQLFKKGLLPPKMREKCFNVLRSLITGHAKHDLRRGAEAGVRDLLLLAGSHAPPNLEQLKERVKEFEPHVIYLDSFYHMDTSRSERMTVRWQKISATAEDVKAYAEEVGLPIVAVHQASRMGEKTYGNTLADLADADVIAREADLLIRIMKPPGAPRELYEEDYEEEFSQILRSKEQAAQAPTTQRKTPKLRLRDNGSSLDDVMFERLKENAGVPRVGGELALVLGGNREGVLEAFTIKAIPAYNFTLISDKPDMKQIKEWVSADNVKDDASVVRPKKAKQGSDSAGFSQALSNSGIK